MTGRVYLCGPITGGTVSEAKDWREYVRGRLASDLIAVDPTRDSMDLARRSRIQSDPVASLQRLLHGKEIVARDRMDVSSCDMLLAHFMGSKEVSIGSVGEIFWADSYRKPIIVVRENEGNPHDHDMINTLACGIYNDLAAAVDKINRMISVSASSPIN